MLIKTKLKEQVMLVGEAKCGYTIPEVSEEKQKEFLLNLQQLMYKYGVAKIDVCWDINYFM